jgi:hypothetical protein
MVREASSRVEFASRSFAKCVSRKPGRLSRAHEESAESGVDPLLCLSNIVHTHAYANSEKAPVTYRESSVLLDEERHCFHDLRIERSRRNHSHPSPMARAACAPNLGC